MINVSKKPQTKDISAKRKKENKEKIITILLISINSTNMKD